MQDVDKKPCQLYRAINMPSMALWKATDICVLYSLNLVGIFGRTTQPLVKYTNKNHVEKRVVPVIVPPRNRLWF